MCDLGDIWVDFSDIWADFGLILVIFGCPTHLFKFSNFTTPQTATFGIVAPSRMSQMWIFFVKVAYFAYFVYFAKCSLSLSHTHTHTLGWIWADFGLILG